MKLTSNILSLFFLFTFGLFVACHEADDDSSNDTTDPVLAIFRPLSNMAISGPVTIKGLVTDNSLHELKIKITKDADGSTLLESSPTVHDLTEFSIDQTWTPTGITDVTPVTLTVTAEDHNNHSVSQTVHFVVNP